MTMVANYKTKKELKECVGQQLCYTENSLFGPEYKPNGVNHVVGPSAYSRKWYGQVTMKDGRIVKVK